MPTDEEKKHRHQFSDLIDIMQKTPVNYKKFIKAPYEGGNIGKIHLIKKGGMLTELSGFDEPYRGFPLSTTIDKLDTVKRMIRVVMLDVFKQFKSMSLLGKVRLFFMRKRLFIFVLSFIKGLHNVLRLVYLKPIRYSTPVREVYRVMTLGIEKERKPGMKVIAKMMRDIICMIFEFDNAYRYRLQDYAEEIVIDRLFFSKEDKAFTCIRKDYKFKHKRELGNPEGLPVMPKCRIVEKTLREKVERIKELRKNKKDEELKEMGVYEMLVEIETLSDEQDEMIKQFNNDSEKLRKECGFVLREDRINELDSLLVEQVKKVINK